MPRTVIHSLKVVHQGKDILVTHGHLLQHGDFISNLFGNPKKASVLRAVPSKQIRVLLPCVRAPPSGAC